MCKTPRREREVGASVRNLHVSGRGVIGAAVSVAVIQVIQRAAEVVVDGLQQGRGAAAQRAGRADAQQARRASAHQSGRVAAQEAVAAAHGAAGHEARGPQ